MAAARKRNTAEDSGKAGVEPSVRTFTKWTPALIRGAELSADGGNLRQAANLCDWMLGDDRIGPLLHTRVQTLLGIDPTFEASGDKRRSNRVVRALEVQEDWWAAYPETELMQLLTWGILLGVKPARHQWVLDEDHGNRLLAMPECWHPQHLRYDWQTREWKIRVSQSSGLDAGIEQVLVPGDGDWILHTPYGKNRPWAYGLWRGLARMALLKTYAISDWSKHGEKGSLLAIESGLGEIPSTARQRKELAQDIFDRGKDAIAVLPPGFSIKLVEAKANTKNIYDAQIEMANKAIAIAIRGGNLSTDVEEGSRAAAEVHERLGDRAKLRFDAQGLTSTIHDQSLVYWAEFNFGDRKLAPWPVYPTDEDEDLGAKAETAGKAFAAATQATMLGFEVDPEGFIQEFDLGFWLKPPSDGKLKPPLPPAAPGEKPEEKPASEPKAKPKAKPKDDESSDDESESSDEN